MCQLNEVAAFFWEKIFWGGNFSARFLVFLEIEGGPLYTGCAGGGDLGGGWEENYKKVYQSLSAVRLRVRASHE